MNRVNKTVFYKPHLKALVAAIAVCSFPTVHAQEILNVEITGSSLTKAASEGALPVQVISKEQIADLAVRSTEQLMQALPAFQSLGGTHLQLEGAGGTSNYGGSFPSLRGIGASYTVTLVNGRKHSGNLNSIPLAAIDRVEILTDGASSIYGSDAIAGVVNIILKKDFEGASAGIQFGTPTRSGGGQQYSANYSYGFGNFKRDGFNITSTFGIEKDRRLMATDRSFSATGNVPPYLFAGATGQGNIEGAWKPGVGPVAPFSYAIYGHPLSPNELNATDRCADIKMYDSTPIIGTPTCLYDSSQDVGLIGDRSAKSVVLNGRLKVNSGEAFGGFTYNKARTVNPYQPSPNRNLFMQTSSAFDEKGIDRALLIYPENPAYKIASDYLIANGHSAIVGQPLAITARVFDFGNRTNVVEVTESQLTGGFRGKLGESEWEISAQKGSYESWNGVTDGYFLMSEYAKIVSSSNDWNPWIPASEQTQRFKDAVKAAKFQGFTQIRASDTTSVDGRIAGQLAKLAAGDMYYLAGFNTSKSSLQITPNSASDSGDIAGLGGGTSPFDRSRRTSGVFGEVVVPVAKSIEVSASARKDDYSDVSESPNTYKVSARWQISQQALMRASTGTGFSAPSMLDLYSPTRVGTSEQFIDPAFPGLPIQVNAESGGNAFLKPERSRQASIGVVLSPVKGLNFGMDYWRIDINDKISSASASEIVTRFRAGDTSYAPYVTIDPATNQVTKIKTGAVNVAEARAAGVDVNGSYSAPADGGRMSVSLNGTLMTRLTETNASGFISKKIGTMVESDGTAVIGADDGGVAVRWRHNLTFAYAKGTWSGALTQSYYSGYRTANRQWDDERHDVTGQAIYGLRVSHAPEKNVTMSLGIKNLFDKAPPLYIPISNQFAAGYDIAMYDPRGRFIYTSIDWKF